MIGLDPPPRLDKALARDVDPGEALSRSRIARLIEGGAVARGGAAERSGKAAAVAGDVWEIAVPPAEGTAIAAQDIALRVVWEDAHLIVIDKPAGMVVHPAPGSPDGTLVNALMHHLGAISRASEGGRAPGSSTASTRTPRGCWSPRRRTPRITGWPRSSRRTPSTGSTARSVTGPRTRPIRA